ncbi:sulfotransferase domain-containing protein [Gemmatimonadota bacterium]
MQKPQETRPASSTSGRAAHRPQIDFVVAGAQKSGTRALAHYLSQHPDIGRSRENRPEPHFFDWELRTSGHTVDPDAFQRYHDMFTPEALAKVTGDITPNYLYDTESLGRICAYNPAMKVIVLLRNPIDRAYSQWVMQVQTGRESRAFLPALIHEFFFFHAKGQHRNFSYVQRGFYDAQIGRLQSLFPAEQRLILRTEELLDDHTDTLRRVFSFLEVPPTTIPPPEQVHVGDYEPMSPYTRRLLRSVFGRDIRRLETRLGWDCSTWR